MKVFLSWSGQLSRKLACAFRDWLPSVIQSVKPYVSSEDIDKGARWSTDIAQELEASSFGVICITKDNLGAPWINFEAGALSKTVDKSKVCPLLFNVKRSEVQGPLLQFQSALCDEDEIKKLVVSINSTLPENERLDEPRLKKIFEVWWPQLNQQFESLKEEDVREAAPKVPAAEEPTQAILEELLELARNQTKLLRSPPDLFPPEYIQTVIGRSVSRVEPQDPEFVDALTYLLRRRKDLLEGIEALEKTGVVKMAMPEFEELRKTVDQIGSVSEFLKREYVEKPALRRK